MANDSFHSQEAQAFNALAICYCESGYEEKVLAQRGSSLSMYTPIQLNDQRAHDKVSLSIYTPVSPIFVRGREHCLRAWAQA